MFNLGGSEVEVLGPVGQYNDTNNSSIVMKLTYGATSFLFTGDAERDAEQDILEAGYDISATVYHVGHHGSYTSTTYPFLREIMPQYAVISCGSGNSYGHPHDDTLSRLRDADVTVYRTDMQGTITCVSDGTTVSFSTERNTGAVTNPTQPSVSVDEEYYIGNVKSHKFHRQSCSGLPAEQNRVILETRETAINGGYDPCGTCKP
jgi:competence protein ComEC